MQLRAFPGHPSATNKCAAIIHLPPVSSSVLGVSSQLPNHMQILLLKWSTAAAGRTQAATKTSVLPVAVPAIGSPSPSPKSHFSRPLLLLAEGPPSPLQLPHLPGSWNRNALWQVGLLGRVWGGQKELQPTHSLAATRDNTFWVENAESSCEPGASLLPGGPAASPNRFWRSDHGMLRALLPGAKRLLGPAPRNYLPYYVSVTGVEQPGKRGGGGRGGRRGLCR